MKKLEIIYKKYSIKNTDTKKFGDYIAKLTLGALEYKEQKNKIGGKKSKLILVTAVSPTKSGEGKTTVSIGLAQALNQVGIKTTLALREPSLGPVFGMKGGATGGGKSQILPSNDINLHFTGDLHAITSANNLLAAALDNHIYFGNKLDINTKKVVFKRCLDMNDRTLRNQFNITAASELMAILCLTSSISDLRARISRIVIAQNSKGDYIYAKDLGVVGAMLVLLKDALMPNIVQTTEGALSFVHGGPFANIAHGCNSLLATRAALAYSDICITEAGFGADLGAEKFFDIALRILNTKRKEKVWPAVVVLVATVKSVHSQGEGLENILRHIENCKKFGSHVVVVINKFEGDTEKDIKNIINACRSIGTAAFCTTVFKNGGKGATDLAKYIKGLVMNREIVMPKTRYLYDDKTSLKNKIETVAKEIYRAKKVVYSKDAVKKLIILQKSFGSLPVCIAKNQYSLSDNPKLLGAPIEHTLHITEAFVQNGAGFVTVLAGTVHTMPGLSRATAAEHIDLDKNDQIVGLK